jgi:transcriptional regulator with XRE-family HTH domain
MFEVINILKLKGRLREKNLTQEQMAKLMKINPSTLNKKLNDEAGETLTIEEACKIKKILEIPVNEVSSYFFVNKLEETQEK